MSNGNALRIDGDTLGNYNDLNNQEFALGDD